MEATALSVGKSVVSGALGYAKSAIAQEVALQLGIQKDQAFVSDELEMMQSFMMAAHEERDDNKVVQTWVKQVRDTAYDVEDSLQDFAVRLVRPSRWNTLRTLMVRRHVAKQMQELRAKVEDISQRNVRYRLIKGSGSKAITVTEQSNMVAAAIFGVDDARHAARHNKKRVDLVQVIRKEDQDPKVIAVWGTSGDIGLTSLIREAYERPDVQSKFSVRAWVKMMHPFNPKGFVQSLVNQFHAAKGVEGLLETKKTRHQDLALEFNRFVNEERCLIVLNGLSTIEEWDQIEKCFQNIKKGSRIIVSTRQVEVAVLCAGKKSEASEIKQLSADQTLYAFYETGSQTAMDSAKSISSSDAATTSTNDHTVEDQSKDEQDIVVSPGQVEALSLYPGQVNEVSELNQLSDDQIMSEIYKGSQNRKYLGTPASTSDVAATSTNDHIVVHSEITEEKSKNATDKKKVVKKSLTRKKTNASAFQESQLIGRDEEIDCINKLISSKDSKDVQVIPGKDVQVISVWGMGGLGKTTLVDRVYQNQKLSENFEKCVFVTIMRPFDPAKLLRSLAMGLREKSSKKELLNATVDMKELETMGVDELTEELARLLGNKSCLIVLDDLSSITEWDLIKPKFPHMRNTSRIIVTTREKNIAEHCSGKDAKVHNLKALEHASALDLFTEKVFGKATDLVMEYPQLDEEGKKILKKCDGLPLPIVTLGGFLASRPKTQTEWRKLSENINAELDLNPELGMIKTVLGRSYDGLPYHLKSCFLYLSIFPEDYIISRRRLVLRWAAEGYSHEMRGKSANAMADNYFTELQNRSMILPSQQSVSSRKSVDSCKVHDLIRDIAISKSMEENLIFRLEEGCGSNTHGAIRHLAISSNWKGDQSEFESIVDQSRIRSLSVFGKLRSFYISDKMRFLRVLDLEGTEDLKNHHLCHIGKLLHLKYLSVRGCEDIFQLPDSLGTLRQLQTLDVRDTSIMTLPKTIIKLRKLRHIYAGFKYGSGAKAPGLAVRCLQLLSFVLFRCGVWKIDGLNRHDVGTIASNVGTPVIISSFEDGGATVPIGTGQLKDMHTMKVINVGRGDAVLRDMKRLTGLRKLGVAGINKKNSQAFCLVISNLGSLESLSVRTTKTNLCGCLDEVSSPPENLQSLKLDCNLKRLPEWIRKCQQLVKFELAHTGLQEHDAAMEFLGSLLKLEILSLVGDSFKGENLHFQRSKQTENTAFGSLRVLQLSLLFRAKSVKFEAAMPKLERLHVMWFVNDIGLAGIELHKSITEVQLHLCDVTAWARISGAPDEIQESRRKQDDFKKRVRDQLAGHANQPILTFP